MHGLYVPAMGLVGGIVAIGGLQTVGHIAIHDSLFHYVTVHNAVTALHNLPGPKEAST
jgi:hypothetical protein